MTGQFFYPITNWHLPPPATDRDFWASDCVHGGAKVIRSDVLRGIYSAQGYYFRDDLFMYMEGAEFHHYVARLGYKSFVAKNAVVYHRTPEVRAARRIRSRTTTRNATGSWSRMLCCPWVGNFCSIWSTFRWSPCGFSRMLCAGGRVWQERFFPDCMMVIGALAGSGNTMIDLSQHPLEPGKQAEDIQRIKSALIRGISAQEGSEPAAYLLDLGYQVWGLV